MRSVRAGWLPAVALASAAFLLSCASTTPDSPPRPHRVVLISLDGASAHELWKLHHEGQFSEGGFERFFAAGEVAEGLVEIDPPLTAPSHISLATGFPPAQTGIVCNWFHRPGQPFFERESGFAAPIGTETLWEAARRQQLAVGVVGWPGADNADPRRRGDWGLAYTNSPQRPARTLRLGAGDFTPVGSDSTAPVHITALPTAGGEPERLRIVALDRTDDGLVQYDALSIQSLAPGAEAAVVLAPGAWARLWLPALATENELRAPVLAWVKVVTLDPELREVVLYLGASYPTPAYPRRFAKRLADQQIAWPGPPDDRALDQNTAGQPGIDLDAWLEQTERFAQFFVDAMLVGARSLPWDLLIGYLPVIDETGHQLLLEDPRQVGWTPEREREFAAGRARVWRAVDRQIARLLDALDLASTTVLLVSDHGMAPVHSVVDVNRALLGAGWQDQDRGSGQPAQSSRAAATFGGGLAHVYLNLVGRDPQGTVPPEQASATVEELRRYFLAMEFGGERVVRDVFSRGEARSLGLDHPNSGDLVLRAAPGFWFGLVPGPSIGEDYRRVEPVQRSPALGQHGFPSAERRMHGISLALGEQASAARPGLVPALGVAPRVAAWLGISPPLASVTNP